MIDLTIKTLDSQNHSFSVPDAFTILDLKEHIVDKVNVPIIQQRLIFCGRVLNNEIKLSDIGIHGKVMHLVQKAPPRLATTTSGSSSSTTTNTNSRPGQNNGHGFRGWHAYDPTVLFGAIGIPSELINAGELPRIINPRNTQTCNRISLALDMVRKGHDTLNRLETIQNNGIPPATDGEQIPEGSQQAEATLRNVPPVLSTPPTQSDPEVNVSYEVDDSFPNTVVVTIDATHHMRVPPGLMRHMQNHFQGTNNLQTPPSSSTNQTVERETTAVPETTSAGPTNQSSTEQATTPLPSSAVYDERTREIDAIHYMSPGLMRHIQNHLRRTNSLPTPSSSSTNQSVERESMAVPETTSVGPTNQPSAEQGTTPLPPSAVYDESTRAYSTSITDVLDYLSPEGIRQLQNLRRINIMQTPQSSSTNQTVERETTAVPENTSAGQTNQSSTERTTRPLPSSAVYDQSTRSATTSVSERRRLRDLIEQLNKLNSRLQPFYVLYCQYLTEDPQFETSQGERGSTRAQIVYNSVSEVLHYISHIYHLISDLRVSFSRPPNRLIQSRPYLMQGTILHTAHSVTTTTTATPPSTQQPTSTQTTNTSQSIPSVRAFRLDFMNPEGVVNETPTVSTSATSTEANTNANVTVDQNTDGNNPSTEFPTDTPNGLAELVFDMAPGTIHIDTVEAAFINPNTPGTTPPTGVSQPSSNIETSNNSMPIDWVDQMIDVISNGVRRPFMSEQTLDWAGIPTTSTQTPRVTPRTADSSSTTNPPPSQSYGSRPTMPSIPRLDPYLPCNSHHFESNLRPVVLARRTQGTDRSSSANGNSNSEFTSVPFTEIRPTTVRRTGRPRTRYVHDIDGFMSGIHPILNFGRNHRYSTNNATPGSNNAQATGQSGGPTDTMSGGQIRVDIGSIFDRIEREGGFERTREITIHPPMGSGLGIETITVPESTGRRPSELLFTPIGRIPFFRNIEGRYLLVDLFLLIARDWTLHDIIHLNTIDQESSIVRHPVTRHTGAIVNFFLDRIMRNQPHTNHNIDEAASRIFVEIVAYVHVFQCSVPTRTNIDLNATFRRCIIHNLRRIAVYCDENRATPTLDILPTLFLFAEAILSLIAYSCNNCAVFRLCVGSIMQFMPLPPVLRQLIMDEVRVNVDQYWETLANNFQMRFPVVEFIVPLVSSEFEVPQTSTVGNEERSSNSTLPSQEIVNEPLPEVVLGSQDWHHSVPSEWVPVITRDTQRQRRQGTQPPYSDAYLSGMPNKRRKIVTSSKPQGSLSQIIAKNLEVAMGAAGVTINKEVTATVGSNTAIQNAYTKRIKTLGRSGLDTHPDFSHDRYPNASQFFYDHNRPN